MRGRREYPICPAAPVIETTSGFFIGPRAYRKN